jgi:hypothetical protein
MRAHLTRFLGGAMVGVVLGVVEGIDPLLAGVAGGAAWLLAGAGRAYGIRRARRTLPRHEPDIEGADLFFSAAFAAVWAGIAVYGLVARDFGLARAGAGVAALSAGCAFWWRRRLRDLR